MALEDTQLLNDLINYENDFKWFQKNHKDLKERFRGMVILIKDKQFITSGKTVEEVKEKAEKLKIDITKSFVQFIPEEEITAII